MGQFDRPRKNCFEEIATRVADDGRMVTIIKDIDEGVYWVGYDLTLDNLNEGGPYGCYTKYDEEDARAQMEDMT